MYANRITSDSYRTLLLQLFNNCGYTKLSKLLLLKERCVREILVKRRLLSIVQHYPSDACFLPIFGFLDQRAPFVLAAIRPFPQSPHSRSLYLTDTVASI
ncbi:hypothetical protein T08_11762 [Trichinella sp. T8]|nr:hypothetical protein T08_11762 [Trichinella sp. T8]